MSQGNGRMPEGWARVTLSDVCEINPKHDRELSDSLEVSFIPMAAVSDVRGEVMKSDSRPLGKVRKGYTHFANGDVLWAKITPCMENGKAAVARALVGGLGCGTTEFFVLRSQGAVLPDFLHRFMRQESYRKAARATMQSGVGQARVPKEFVESTEIPLPPLPEQRRIVDRIEELQARTRRAREALESVPALLEQFRQSVLASAFRGDLTADWRERHPDAEPASVLLERIRTERRRRWEAAELEKMRAKGKAPKDDRWKDKYKEPEPVDASGLPELPEGWAWAMLAQVGDWTSGGTPSRSRPDFYGGDIPWVKTGELHDRLITTTEEFLTPLGVEQSSAKVLPLGTVLIAMYGATIGKLGLLGVEAATNQACAALLPNPFFGVDRKYIFYYLLRQREALKRLGQGGAQPNISQTLLKDYLIPIPPAAEQAVIIRIVQGMLDRAESMVQVAQQATSELPTLNASVLARAFRGELVPQDPNDEPASVLLERVREGHAQASRPRRRS